MFEVVVIKYDGTTETYDALTENQAECIFFRARMKEDTKYVEINEIIEEDDDVLEPTYNDYEFDEF